MHTWLIILGLIFNLGQVLSGYNEYPVPNLDQLSPLTVNWNDVHYLVRQNLLDVDELRKEHEQIYADLQKCFGLEECLTAANLIEASVETAGADYEAGSLLEQLQREREQLLRGQSGMDAEMRERQRLEQWRREQQQQGQQQSYSYSYNYQYGSEVSNNNQQNDWQRGRSGGRYGESRNDRG